MPPSLANPSLRGPSFTGVELSTLPTLRKPKPRSNRPLNLSRSSNRRAFVVQSAGETRIEPCSFCKDRFGPWEGCVVVKGRLEGTCANCLYNNKAKRCSFRTDTMVKQESLASDEDGEDGQSRKRMKDDGNLSDFPQPSQTIYQKSLIQVVIPSASASISNRAIESMLPTQSDRRSNMSKERQPISKPLQLTPEEYLLVKRLNQLAKAPRHKLKHRKARTSRAERHRRQANLHREITHILREQAAIDMEVAGIAEEDAAELEWEEANA